MMTNTRNGPGKAFALVLLGLLLFSACVPVESSDPSLIAEAAAARVHAEMAQATANSAEYLAKAQEIMLTATAEAPSIRMTQQAAELEIYMTRQAVDATVTAQSWTPTPSRTPTPDLTATVAVMQVRAQQTISAKQSSDYIVTSELELRRKVLSNQFYATLPVLVFALIAGILLLLVFVMVRSKRFQAAPVNAQGEVLPVIDIYSHSINDTRRMPNYRGYTDDSALRDLLMAYIMRKLQMPPALPEITSERQDATTARAQMVELARATQQPRQALPAQFSAPLLASPISMNGERFDVADGETLSAELGPEIMQILEAQWRDV